MRDRDECFYCEDCGVNHVLPAGSVERMGDWICPKCGSEKCSAGGRIPMAGEEVIGLRPRSDIKC